MGMLPTDIQFNILDRVLETYSACVARSCAAVMQGEESNFMFDESTSLCATNIMQRIIPLVLTPLDIGMSRASYLWLYSLCCSYKIPVSFAFLGTRGITESTWFKKFLEIFNPIEWWKSTLESTDKYLVLMNIRREFQLSGDGSFSITLKPNLEVPGPDYRYVSPIVNPVDCNKYFGKMCALNKVEESSDSLFIKHEQDVQRHQNFFLSRESDSSEFL